MSTKTRERKAQGTSAPVSNAFDNMMAVLGKHFDGVLIYGGNGTPLYDLVAVAGNVKAVNTPAKALTGDFNAIKAAIKPGTAAFMVGQFDNHQLAIRTAAGLAFAGVMHDKDGEPLDDVDLTLCVVECNRDFDIPNTDVTIEKGTRFVKALPAAYVAKLKKVAA